MKTKKFPVSISFRDFKAKSEEFLIPHTGKGRNGFRGLNSGRVAPYGLITFVGKEISANDVFARLVDSGQVIDDVDGILATIDRYLKECQQFKIGNIISIVYSDNGSDFQLFKKADRPPKQESKKGRLP